MLCLCLCLFICRIIENASSSTDGSKSTLNLPHHHRHHLIIILASIQQPRVLNQLQLEVSHKQDELLMLLDNRLNFGGKIIKTSIQMQE